MQLSFYSNLSRRFHPHYGSAVDRISQSIRMFPKFLLPSREQFIGSAWRLWECYDASRHGAGGVPSPPAHCRPGVRFVFSPRPRRSRRWRNPAAGRRVVVLPTTSALLLRPTVPTEGCHSPAAVASVVAGQPQDPSSVGALPVATDGAGHSSCDRIRCSSCRVPRSGSSASVECSRGESHRRRFVCSSKKYAVKRQMHYIE